ATLRTMKTDVASMRLAMCSDERILDFRFCILDKAAASPVFDLNQKNLKSKIHKDHNHRTGRSYVRHYQAPCERRTLTGSIAADARGRERASSFDHPA